MTTDTARKLYASFSLWAKVRVVPGATLPVSSAAKWGIFTYKVYLLG